MILLYSPVLSVEIPSINWMFSCHIEGLLDEKDTFSKSDEPKGELEPNTPC